jgi:hypothetical protein
MAMNNHTTLVMSCIGAVGLLWNVILFRLVHALASDPLGRHSVRLHRATRSRTAPAPAPAARRAAPARPAAFRPHQPISGA